MDEVYVSSIGTIRSSDTVFESPHIDGPFGFLLGAYLFRTIVAISENGYIETIFPNHDTKHQLETGEYLSFDYNREVHYIRSINIPKPGNRRIVLKIHYSLYHKNLYIYGLFNVLCNTIYNTIARILFVKTLKPVSNLEQILTNIILYTTDSWKNIETYIGFDNIIYSILLFLLPRELRLYLSSFIHYIIYITTFYYRRNISFNYFIRNCLFYKTLSIINILQIIYKSEISILMYIFIILGYGLTILASYRLGKEYTYFGIELGIVPYKQIDSFPYGNYGIPHPMIVGQLIVFTTLALTTNYTFYFSLHIILYIIHMLQEILNIYDK